jgi:outer membrane receptor protein involved in Fe transport
VTAHAGDAFFEERDDDEHTHGSVPPRWNCRRFHCRLAELLLKSRATADVTDSQGLSFGLDEVVITASPLLRTPAEQAQPVSVLTGQELLLKQQPTLGETVSSIPGVSSTYFGPGASRPVIRGLVASKPG